MNHIGTGVRLVDLVDDHHRAQIELQRLVEHETGLRHRPLGGVDQKNHAVGKFEHPFDLAAEVAVSGGVDHIDFDPFVLDADVLGKDGDAAFAFKIVVVQKAFRHDFVVPEHLRLPENLVDQRRFAVVDVRDDCDISDFAHKNRIPAISEEVIR